MQGITSIAFGSYCLLALLMGGLAAAARYCRPGTVIALGLPRVGTNRPPPERGQHGRSGNSFFTPGSRRGSRRPPLCSRHLQSSCPRLGQRHRLSRTAPPRRIVLGQPNLQQSNQYGIGTKGFAFPFSVSVDPITGNLYVADLGNSRVLRFPKPFANPTRVEPDAVYGQPDFATRSPNSSGVTEHTMNAPRGVAVDGQGNLWVADTGNHRVLHFPAAVLNATNPAADFALGQPDLHSARANQGAAVSASGFNQPDALAFDAQNNLYVADYLNSRVLKFPSPVAGRFPSHRCLRSAQPHLARFSASSHLILDARPNGRRGRCQRNSCSSPSRSTIAYWYLLPTRCRARRQRAFWASRTSPPRHRIPAPSRRPPQAPCPASPA